MNINSFAASSSVKIQGHVFSPDGEPLEGANLIVEGTNYGDASNTWGYYQIAGVPPGIYTLRCILIGYKASHRYRVEVKTDITTKINFYLEPDTLLLQEITITAPKTSLAELFPSIEIITSEEIQKSSAQTVSELLTKVPGVFVKSYGNAGAQQTISIRGSESNQVLLLVDGQRFTSAQNGTADLTAIPLSSIESIEILKGSASALFGSNAMGGVINIRTKSGPRMEKLDVSQHTGYGSFDTRTFALQLGQSSSHAKYNLAFDWLASDGDFKFVNTSRGPQPVQKRRNADFQSYNGFVKLQWVLAKKALLEASGQFYKLSSGTPGEIANPTPNAHTDDTRYLSRFVFHNELNRYVNFSLAGFYNVFENQFTDPDLTYLNGQNKNKSFGFEAKQKFRFKNVHVTTGFGFTRDEVVGTDILGRPTRENLSCFLQNQFKFENISSIFHYATFYPALRFDYFSKSGTEINPKLGLVLGNLIVPNLNFQANIGRSFRVPSFNSLFLISGVQVRSNPDLNPEHSFDFDLGLNFHRAGSKSGRQEFDISYFQRNVDGTILWLPDFRFIWSPRNIAQVINRGVEITTSWLSGDEKVNINFNYTFMNARFDLPGNTNPVPYRPRHVLNLDLGMKLMGISTNIQERWVSKRFPNVAGTNSIPSYWLTDLNFFTQVALGKIKIVPKFVITNFFAENYQVVNNFPMPGRAFRFSLNTNF